MGYFRCSKGESLWDIGIEQRAAAEKTEEKSEEKHLLILGNKTCVSVSSRQEKSVELPRPNKNVLHH